MEQWAAAWDNINRQVDEELNKEDVGETDVTLKAEAEADVIDYGEEKKDTTFKRTAVVGILENMADKLSKSTSEIKDIINVIEREVNDDKLGKILMANFGSKSAVKYMETDKQMMSGEWMDIALQKLEAYSTNTKFMALNSLMKLVLYDVVPYDISYPRPTRQNPEEKEKEDKVDKVHEEQEGRNPEEADPEEDSVKGKKSALSIGKYKVKSTIEPDGSRTWYCPYEDCSKVFRSSGKCHGHLNEHISRIYECPKCKYSGYSLDAYKKHVCFKGWKTQGEVKRVRPNPYKLNYFTSVDI